MGLKGASSAPDGGCSFTFIDWWKIKGEVNTVLLLEDRFTTHVFFFDKRQKDILCYKDSKTTRYPG